ncbi:MAG TPA: hypothetical protein VMT94_07730 [Burkholderiales bacterium]|nr:hypothetical protein [Burkholderiales bacterium]
MMNPPDKAAPAADKAETENTVYLYENAGIEERHGHIPAWLWAVVIVLSAWGIYYLITYWQPPLPS